MGGEGRPMLALFGRSDRRMSEALHRQVPSDATPDPAGLLGLELEFSRTNSVRRTGPFRFTDSSPGVRMGARWIPGDPNAYRCSWGGVITSDGAEAEIATPPVWTRPGFTGELQAWAESGKAALRRAVPHGIELDGYSAHFSAGMPTRLNDPVCRLYAETFAADLMLLMDRANSPGLLVRPSPGTHGTVRRVRSRRNTARRSGLCGRDSKGLRRGSPHAERRNLTAAQAGCAAGPSGAPLWLVCGPPRIRNRSARGLAAGTFASSVRRDHLRAVRILSSRGRRRGRLRQMTRRPRTCVQPRPW